MDCNLHTSGVFSVDTVLMRWLGKDHLELRPPATLGWVGQPDPLALTPPCESHQPNQRSFGWLGLHKASTCPN